MNINKRIAALEAEVGELRPAAACWDQAQGELFHLAEDWGHFRETIAALGVEDILTRHVTLDRRFLVDRLTRLIGQIEEHVEELGQFSAGIIWTDRDEPRAS